MTERGDVTVGGNDVDTTTYEVVRCRLSTSPDGNVFLLSSLKRIINSRLTGEQSQSSDRGVAVVIGNGQE